MARIYTRTGDDGTTGLGGGQRVPKDAGRIQAYGTVDELNSVIGVALAAGVPADAAAILERVQHELFDLGSDLCFLEADKARFTLPQIEQRHVDALEAEMDRLTARLEPLRHFILPGGTPGAAHLHQARTVCRRAEREVLALAREEAVGPFVVKYLNRLSDALFVMARHANHQAGRSDVTWNPKT